MNQTTFAVETIHDSPSITESTIVPEAAAAPKAERPKGWRPFALPDSVTWRRVRWGVTLTIALLHALALLAVLPWLFSWTGLVLAIAGIYIFGTLGINICFHRLLTHRSFKTPRWFERTLAVLGMCCLEGSPVTWVANHRMHHQHSDDEPDPHSPVVAFLWSHIGWMLLENRNVNSLDTCGRYARDICKDPFYLTLERRQRWLVFYMAHIALYFGLGFGLGSFLGGAAAAGVQLGLSWIVWGVFVRTILVWHITWSVNSLTHVAGYRNYETDENSRNNWLVGLIAMGEGWHNNHHADQRSAAHGHRWWELDCTYLTILLFKRLGLARDIVLPKFRRAEAH